MTLTTHELTDLISLTLLSYLRKERGETLKGDEAIDLVKWVRSQDLDYLLDNLRWED